jgi:hypothetical protein
VWGKLLRMKTFRRALVRLLVASSAFAQGAPRMEEVVQAYVRKSLKLEDTPVAKTIIAVRDKPLDFVPGERMSYSN